MEKRTLKLSEIINQFESEIIERNKAEQKALESEAKIRAIWDNVPYLAWLKDKESRFINVNKIFEMSHGPD